jgi:Xaa-Pro aminopeptidase
MPSAKTNLITSRLKSLRLTFKKLGLDGILVPRSDEYQGEYVPACAERLQWITNFTGSAGTFIISLKRAVLIIDGRYTIQAASETNDTGIATAQLNGNSSHETISSLFKSGARLGVDPWLIPHAEFDRLQKICEALGLALVALNQNPIDAIWHDRPLPPQQPITRHDLKYAGLESATKIQSMAQQLTHDHCDATVISDPLSVAWLFNIRGQDVPYTPVALLRAIVQKNAKSIVFVDSARLTADVVSALSSSVTFRSPKQFEATLQKLGKSKMRVSIDPQSCPHAIVQTLAKSGATIREASDLCILPRAMKNKTELNGARKAHKRDGAALCNFLSWLATHTQTSKLTERQAQDKLTEYRNSTGKLVDQSFGTISASGPNAALPHYHVTGKSGRTLQHNQIFLIDSGGQYRDGTTDITRTVIIGNATQDMREKFTLVLKGMIAVSTARFPEGTTGAQIDTLARAALWQHGLDFDHGTGHGVGSFLSVHEGPARISKAGNVALRPGMILSNEPGYYRPGHFGIRIENLLIVQNPRKRPGQERPMLSFETLSYVPIDKNLIDSKLLTRAELQWLDAYHAKAFQMHADSVEPAAQAWLESACQKLT